MKAQVVLHRVFEKGRISFELPASEVDLALLTSVLRVCKDKHADYVSVTISPPYKPRTTGKHSQNHHLNGHIMQICEETGNDYESVKYCVKMTAVENLGYPYTEINGHIFPKRECDCNTEECAKLIEAAHLLAADLNIVLRESL